MANVQQVFSDYLGSEKTLIEALPYTQCNLLYESAAYNLLGISSKELSNYDDALYYYDKAKSTTKDTLARISIDNNKASVYIQKKEFNSSIKLLEPILKSNILDTFYVKKARVLDNLGYSYYKSDRNKEGFPLMNEALNIRKKSNDSYGIIGSCLHLAEFFQKTQPQMAKKYAMEAYQTTKHIHSINERLESLSFLVSNNFENGNNTYAVEYIRLNDSILKVRNNAKNQFAKIKYDSDQNRAENLKLTTQKTETTLLLERQKNSTLLMYFVVSVLIALAIFVINFLNTKNKKEKIIVSYNTETRISKKLHDELANDVYHAMTFAETQDLSTENNKEILLNDLDNIYSRTRNISKENSTIHVGPHFVVHLKEMMSNYSNDKVNVLVNGLDVLQNITLATNKKITVYRILQELLVNMKKHSQCSIVVITFKKIDKKIQIEYSDNGIGAAPDKINLKNGLLNVENRIHAINGTLTFDNSNHRGFKVSIAFPI
ncbi:tetratricopeptide repeat-containing sensor histidine kinase [Flavobacterium sp.]|uniref:tetratricopeptide repeat-containing sensor histidine kinase n=1 Tax=Flavobacterium sp. TaxID=239 RepID=UPI002B4B4E68|nr:ATP-binding protein [Flavobacterium sp.]HLF52677.1 ATP-binding protein [Flavobacterium sp.]